MWVVINGLTYGAKHLGEISMPITGRKKPLNNASGECSVGWDGQLQSDPYLSLWDRPGVDFVEYNCA